jgi:hypothetical protein
MPIHVSWFNPPKTILMWEMTDPWNFDDFSAAAEKSRHLADQITHSFDAVVVSNRTGMPPSSVHTLKDQMRTVHPRQRFMVIVNPSDFGKTLLTLYQQLQVPPLNQMLIHFVETLDEALAWLAQQPLIDTSGTPPSTD